MAYRDAVEYIEEMNPAHVRAVGEECLRTKGIIKSALPTLTGLSGKVEWRSDARDLYERRLNETIDLAEGLHDGFDKAGAAIIDYVEAQERAKRRVAEGIAAEKSLGDLIAPIVATQSLVVRVADPLRQWHDLRSTTGPSDFLIELGQRDAIDKVRPQADALWNAATTAYDDAIRLETEARRDALPRLKAAYEMLPDFLANSKLSGEIVDKTPGLEDVGTGNKYHIGPPTKPSLTFDSDFPYDPNAEPTAGDYLSWNKWRLMLRAAQAGRPDLDDATDAYAHYMDGTGTDLRIDYEEAYTEDANVRKAVDNEIALARREAERIYRETGQTAFQMTGDPTSARKLVGEYPASTENWQKTLGDHTVYGTSDVVVNGNQVTMKIKVHAEDVYNFNADANDIATGAPDNENGRFSTLGWAKEFRTYGEVERTVTWTIGDPGSVQVSGDGGTDRNAPGEDRMDGRNSG